jgi:hypothetical protein
VLVGLARDDVAARQPEHEVVRVQPRARPPGDGRQLVPGLAGAREQLGVRTGIGQVDGRRLREVQDLRRHQASQPGQHGAEVYRLDAAALTRSVGGLYDRTTQP